MKKALFLAIISIFCLKANSQTIKGKVLDQDKNPLINATVHWANTQIGTITNEKGEFSIKEENGYHELVASYIGFKSDTLCVHANPKPIFHLESDAELNEIEVKDKRKGNYQDRNSAMQMQRLSYSEICRAACCNLGESFQTNASVDVSYTDASTGAKTIQLLGLQGRYVQFMTENIPNLRGLSQNFGLSFVPGDWMDGISISKGVGTVVNGYEALTGQINIEYQKPGEDFSGQVDLYGSSNMDYQINTRLSYEINHHLKTLLMLNASKDFMKMDENDDNFRDEPQSENIHIFNRWLWNKGIYNGQFLFKSLMSNRIGGQMDFSGKSPSMDLYGTFIKLNRYEFITKNGWIFNDKANLGTTIAFINHSQESFYGIKSYDAKQNSYNVNTIFQYDFNENNTIHTGINVQGDFVDETLNINQELNYNLKENVIGAYFQYTFKMHDDHGHDKFTAILGARLDHSNEFDLFFTPRLHLKYSPLENTTIRAAAGKGYRTALLIGENNHLLSSNRTWRYNQAYDQEIAWNFGVNITQYIPIKNHQMTLSMEYYHTVFNKQMVSDFDISPRYVDIFVDDENGNYADNFQVEMTYSPCNYMDISAGYRINRAMQCTNNEMLQRPLVPKSKGMISLSGYTKEKVWQMDFTVQFNGSGRIPSTLLNPEEFRLKEKFDAYQMFNAQIMRNFEHLNIYVGVENIGNFVQKNPIIQAENPWGEYFDANMIWGPLMKRKIYAGLRIKF